MVLDVITSIMNTMVVDFMKSQEDGQAAVHASERALAGYLSLHHLLVALAVRYPEVVRLADLRVTRFLTANERGKAFIPNIGEFIALLTISGVSWQRLGVPLLMEIWGTLQPLRLAPTRAYLDAFQTAK